MVTQSLQPSSEVPALVRYIVFVFVYVFRLYYGLKLRFFRLPSIFMSQNCPAQRKLSASGIAHVLPSKIKRR
jgi:hypothetical protein